MLLSISSICFSAQAPVKEEKEVVSEQEKRRIAKVQKEERQYKREHKFHRLDKFK